MLIRLDSTQQEQFEPYWCFGTNTCHAALWLRDDLLRQLRRSASELGFRYVRAHGILNDDMVRILPDGTFDYRRCLEAVGRLLSAGLRPFVELSSLPRQIAGGDSCVCVYRFLSSPPADWQQWRNLIDGLVRAFVRTFGADEVRQWYFEVWNEPDIAFWSGTQEEYFLLYDHAAAVIKAIDPALRVGGPATSKTAWIDEFLAHVSKPSVVDARTGPRCDFVSTHAYPSDAAFLDGAQGDVQLQDAQILRQLYRAARQKLDRVFGPTMPLIIGEWNSSAGPLAFNHDDCNNAAFIVKTMVDLMPYCQGSLYWNLSDIYEECGFHSQPFHGGYGLLTVNDLPKAGYHAFRFLKAHRGVRLAVDATSLPEGAGAFATRHDTNTRILLWNYQAPGTQPAELTVTIDIGRACDVEIERIIAGSGSAYESWRSLGSPEYLTEESFAHLLAASRPERTGQTGPRITVQLPAGAIANLTFSA